MIVGRNYEASWQWGNLLGAKCQAPSALISLVVGIEAIRDDPGICWENRIVCTVSLKLETADCVNYWKQFENNSSKTKHYQIFSQIIKLRVSFRFPGQLHSVGGRGAVWIQVPGLLVFMGSKDLTWRGIFPRNSFVESRSLAQQISQPEPQNTRNTISSSTLVLVWGEELSPDWPWAKSQVFSSNNEIWISKYTVILLIKCTNLNLDPRKVCTEPSLTTGHLGLEGQDFHPIPVLSSPGIRRRVEWRPGDSEEIRTLGQSWILTALTLLCY